MKILSLFVTIMLVLILACQKDAPCEKHISKSQRIDPYTEKDSSSVFFKQRTLDVTYNVETESLSSTSQNVKCVKATIGFIKIDIVNLTSKEIKVYIFHSASLTDTAFKFTILPNKSVTNINSYGCSDFSCGYSWYYLNFIRVKYQ